MNLKRVVALAFACILISSSALGQSGLVAASLGLARPGNLKIVMIMDHEGNLSYEVLDDEIINLMKKDLNERLKKAKKQWADERQAWKNHNPKVPFALPKPITPKVTILKKGFDSRSEAESELSVMQATGPFCIVQVVNGEGKKVRIVSTQEVPGVKFSVSKEYHQSLVAWIEEKASFVEENGDKEFDTPLPKKPKFKVLKSNIKTLDKASDLVASKYTT
jgi:hypothetical protein